MPDLYYADGRNADGSLNLKRTREKKDLSFGKDVYSARSYYWELTGNYNRTFGEHRIGGLVLFICKVIQIQMLMIIWQRFLHVMSLYLVV